MTRADALFALAALAHIGDAWTTARGVDSGVMYELNPMMRPVVDHGLGGILAAKAGYLGYLWYTTKHQRDIDREPQMFLALLLGGVAVVNNVAELTWRGHFRVLIPGV